MAELDGIAPLRDQLVTVLRSRIESGQYQRGSKLPTAKELGAEFGISSRTVADAFAILREDGDVIGVRGRGVFVVPEGADASLPENGREVGPHHPLRDQVVAKIRARIESGQYKRGSRLPTMTAAAEEFGVSTRTVVDAFVILRESGEVIGVPGRGVFVAPEAPDG